jgi:hypothetical protein
VKPTGEMIRGSACLRLLGRSTFHSRCFRTMSPSESDMSAVSRGGSFGDSPTDVRPLTIDTERVRQEVIAV